MFLTVSINRSAVDKPCRGGPHGSQIPAVSQQCDRSGGEIVEPISKEQKQTSSYSKDSFI